MSLSLADIGTVDPRRRDLDQHLSVTRGNIGKGAIDQSVRTPGTGDSNRVHS
jgi:hypothetical protein